MQRGPPTRSRRVPTIAHHRPIWLDSIGPSLINGIALVRSARPEIDVIARVPRKAISLTTVAVDEARAVSAVGLSVGIRCRDIAILMARSFGRAPIDVVDTDFPD